VSKNDGVYDLSSLDVSCLFLGNDEGHNGLEVICYHFCYDFVDHIAERNRSELFGISVRFLFSNEGEKGHIEGRKDLA
jgi:hypothetical protein